MDVDVQRPRSAALDGIRGLAMVGFMAYHFGATVLTGAWTGVNVFFVLSGFLIVRLLERERMRTGRVDARAFYLRRARRLLPALLSLLAVVTIWAVFWADPARRRTLGGDVLASLGFVQNWRLIALEDRYFGNMLDPSPLRHVWTLAIEEQFYLLAPLLLGILALLLRSRPARAIALLALAGLSAWWTARLGLHDAADLGRLYYGTDTRVQALLVGAALGVLLAQRPSWLPRPQSPVLVGAGALALAGTAYAFVTVSPWSSVMYNSGGILGLALVQAVLIAAVADLGSAAASPNAVARVLGWAPFAYAGKRSYALYLWHWPVHLWLTPALIGSTRAAGALGMVVTFVIAHLSWRYLEEPVIRGGIRGLMPNAGNRLLAGAVPIAVLALVASVVLRSSPAPTTAATPAETPATTPATTAIQPASPTAAAVPELVVGQPQAVAGRPDRLAVLGDSVPMHLANAFPAATFPGVTVQSFASEGCDLLTEPASLGDGLLLANPDECVADKKEWSVAAERDGLRAVVLFIGPLTGAPHLVDGQQVWLEDAAYRERVEVAIGEVADRASSAGATLFVVNAPCREVPDDQIPDELRAAAASFPEVLDELRQPTRLNALVAEAVAEHEGVRLIDLHSALCPAGTPRTEVAGTPIWGDPLHFSPAIAPVLWSWLLGQVSAGWPEGAS